MKTNVELFEEQYATTKIQRYRTLERLGEGTFGEVRKAVDTVSGKTVAIKYVRILSKKGGVPKAVFREMESLKQLSRCEYVLRLYDVFADEANLCLVMEYVVSDLSEVISQSKQFLPRSHLKAFYKMILQGISYCHERNVMHRDIKPANLLLTSNGIVKLADFGLARIYEAQNVASLSHQVATRQYRAPELLFASRHYTPAVDIWSAAVVMAELATLQALFPGNNDIDQMYRVFQALGSPTPEVWPGVQELPDYCKVHFPNMTRLDLQVLLPSAHSDEVDFLRQLLILDPNKRLTAKNALESAYFSVAPLAVSAGCLYVPVRERASKSSRPKPSTTVEGFMVDVVDNIVNSSVI